MAELSRLERARIVAAWPHILRLATDPWAQRFARSTWERLADPRWLPSLRQLTVIRAMMRQLSLIDDEDPILIEAD